MTWRVTPSSVNSALRNSYEPREEPVACLDVARCRAIGGDPAATCACFAMPRPSGVPNPSMFSERVLDRKKILITGGGTGIGKSLGSRFLGFGAEIVICGRREEILRGTVAEWTKSGGKASYFVCDIRLPDKVEAMFEEIWRDRPLDGLVNNTAGNFIARTETLSPRAFDSVINVVLHGTAYCTLAAGQRWIEGKHAGTILSILTSSAWQGRAFMVPSANRQGWCAFHGAEFGYRMGSQGNPHCHGRPWTLSYRRRVGEARPGLSRIRSAGRARPCTASGTAR